MCQHEPAGLRAGAQGFEQRRPERLGHQSAAPVERGEALLIGGRPDRWERAGWTDQQAGASGRRGIRGVRRVGPRGQTDSGTQVVKDARRQQADQIRVARQTDVDTLEGLRRYRGPADVRQPLEQPHPKARARQVGGRDQAVVTAADDDDVVVGVVIRHYAQGALADVTLDLVGRTHRCFARVAPGFAQGPSLPKQIPTLIEFDFDAAKSLVLVGRGDFALLQLGPQQLFLSDQVADMRQRVPVRRFILVVHRFSVPEKSGHITVCNPLHG